MASLLVLSSKGITGIEPVNHLRKEILSLSCLPFSPNKHYLQIMRFELIYIAWKAMNLPLIYICKSL